MIRMAMIRTAGFQLLLSAAFVTAAETNHKPEDWNETPFLKGLPEFFTDSDYAYQTTRT